MHANCNMLGAFRGDRELHKLYDKDLFLENKIENCSLHMRKYLSYACKGKKTINQAFYSGGVFLDALFPMNQFIYSLASLRYVPHCPLLPSTFISTKPGHFSV